MKSFSLIITVFVFLTTFLSLFAQSQFPFSSQIQAKVQLQQNSIGEISLNWDSQSGSLKTFYGRVPLRAVGETFSTRVLLERFFQENQKIFGISDSGNSLSYISEKQNRNTRLFIYQQSYQGIPVFKHTYRVRINSHDELISIVGKFDPNIYLDSILTAITYQQAYQEALNFVGVDLNKVKNLQNRLVIYASNTSYKLSWKVTFEVYTPPGDWLILVDAFTGNILYKENKITGITGNGKAYTSHPGNGSPTTKSLYFLNTSGYLDGTYVKTNNEDAANAYNPSYQFFYSYTNTSFDEVNVYYHITQMQNNFFKALDPGFNPIKRQATVHYGTNENGAYASQSGSLLFGDGDGISYNDFAKEESVIYHENSHVVIYQASNLSTGLQSEGRAMHEGYSDYFAASFSTEQNIHQIGEWVKNISPGYIRDLENNATYSGSFSTDWDQNGNISAYDYALVWAGALWDCRQNPYNIPPGVIDWISYDALYDLNSSSGFADALTAMINSDNNTYFGVHVSAIRSAFNSRGIYEAVSLYIDGPDALGFKENGTWIAHPSGGNNGYNYQWQYRTAGTTNWTTVGTSQTYTRTMYDSDFELRCTATSIYGLNATDYFYVQYRNGTHIPKVTEDSTSINTAKSINIFQNYPNPFNPTTTIEYFLPSKQHVLIKVFDALGREVNILVNQNQLPGSHKVTFDASNLPSGIYYFELRTNTLSKRIKGVLIR